MEPQNTEAGSSKMGLPEMIMNPSVSEEEESQSDDDMPYFSDVEAMVDVELFFLNLMVLLAIVYTIKLCFYAIMSDT